MSGADGACESHRIWIIFREAQSEPTPERTYDYHAALRQNALLVNAL